MTDPVPSSRWSGEGKAWLVFWIVLAIATPSLPCFFPEWFTNPGKRDWGRVLGPASFLFFIFWLLGVYFWVIWFRNTRRTSALAGVAAAMKFDLEMAPAEEDWSLFGVFEFFRIGFEHSACNNMDGNLGPYEVTVLDYHFRRSALPWDIGIQMSSRKYHQTVVAFWGVSPKLPNFKLLTRETGWFKPGKNRSPKASITEVEIGKGLNDDFQNLYLVGGEDEARLRAFFTPPLLAYFAAHPGWDIEAAEGHLLVYQERKLQPPAKLQQFLDSARQIADTLRLRAEGPRKR